MGFSIKNNNTPLVLTKHPITLKVIALYWPYILTLVERPPFVQPKKGIGPGSFRNRDRSRATIPVRLDRATVPVQLGQRSRFLPITGTNALATNTWRTARHWSWLLA